MRDANGVVGRQMNVPSLLLIESLELSQDSPVWYPMAVKPGNNINIKALIEYLNIDPANKRKALLLVKAYDELGNEVETSFEKMAWSEAFNAHFKYLASTGSDVEELYSAEVPEEVATIHFGFSQFLPKAGEQVVIRDLSIYPEESNEVSEASKEPKTPTKYQVESLVLPQDSPVWYPMAVKPGDNINIKALIEYLNIDPANKRKALLLVKAYDELGNEVETSFNKMAWSEAFNAYFKYLAPTDSEVEELYSVEVPEGVVTVQVGFGRFLPKAGEQVVIRDLSIYSEGSSETSKTPEEPQIPTAHQVESLELSQDSPVWYPMAVKPGDNINIKAIVEYLNIDSANKRKSLLLIKAYDELGNEVETSFEKMAWSEAFDAHFKYLASTGSEVEELYSAKVPEEVATIHFGFSHFLPKAGEQVTIRGLCLEAISGNVIVHNESNNAFNKKHQTIEEFLEKKNKSKAFSSDNLLEVFGLKTDSRTFLLRDNKYFFEALDDKPTYKVSNILWHVSSNLTPKLGIRFSLDVSKNIDVVVIISFFGSSSKKRISYNMLPINKNLTVNVPDNANFFNLGLKITGEGAINFRDIKIELLKPEAKKIELEELDKGISIILPSYKGRNTIVDTLTSITNQRNIDFSLIEVVIVVNGEEDGTIEKVQAFSRKNPFLKIDCSYSEVASASHARNLAILKATKDYLVFCDDDDLLSEEYLAALYKVKGPNSIGFCRIYDLTEDNELQKVNVINNQLLQSLSHNSSDIKHFSSAITMIASKIIPTAKIKNLMFDERLKSGEDVSYFTDYFVTYSPKLIMSDNENSYYIRRVRGNSLSRQKMSFDFNVSQRLDVIKSLGSLKTKASNQEGSDFIESKIRAQCGFIVSYLKENPDDYQNVHLEVIKRKIDNFPYRFLQDRLGLVDPKLLVISYCHPPFVDTSAVVTAKRVFEFNKLCDVVCADMSSVRDVNPDLCKLDQHLIRDSYVISTMASFNSWNSVYDFSTSAMRAVEVKSYDTVYSRSFWPASHFAAFEYKRINPDVRWIAEFSDPVIFNIEGSIRDSKISKSWVKEVVSQFNLKSALLKEFNLYVWCELIVYLFADEIIFTCEDQKNLMLDRFPYSEYTVDKEEVANIAVHPTLPDEFYESYEANYKLDNSKVNLAYFGAFYKTRRLDDLIEVIRLYHKNQTKYKEFKQPLVHIFTEQTASAYEMIEEEGLKDYFTINPYVNYFEFLSISKKMDILIVNDAKAKDVFGFNPYLPSKISDYIGSKSSIWVLYESGSTLFKNYETDFRSELNNIQDVMSGFLKILNNFS